MIGYVVKVYNTLGSYLASTLKDMKRDVVPSMGDLRRILSLVS